MLHKGVGFKTEEYRLPVIYLLKHTCLPATKSVSKPIFLVL